MLAKVRYSKAPSPSTLRFLRQQIDDSQFFASSPPTQRPQHPQLKVAAPVRRLSTSQKCRANVLPFHSSYGPPPSAAVLCQSNFLGLSQSKPLQRSDDPSDRDRLERRERKSIYPWYKRIFKSNGRRNGDEGQEQENLHPLPSFLDDAAGTALGRNKALKPGNEMKLRVTEIDENGNVITVNGEFKKSELIAKVWPPTCDGLCAHTDLGSSTVYCREIFARSTPPSCLISSFGPPLF